jgi:hypothetical protein
LGILCSLFGTSNLFPKVNQLAKETIIALSGSAILVELVLGALLNAYGGSEFTRFFYIIDHIHSLP